jgi:hypothetical protein
VINSEVKSYRERWKALEEVERQEQRSSSIALRWRQLNSILCLAIGLGLAMENPDCQDELARQRWVKLKGEGEHISYIDQAAHSGRSDHHEGHR